MPEKYSGGVLFTGNRDHWNTREYVYCTSDDYLLLGS